MAKKRRKGADKSNVGSVRRYCTGRSLDFSDLSVASGTDILNKLSLSELNGFLKAMGCEEKGDKMVAMITMLLKTRKMRAGVVGTLKMDYEINFTPKKR